MRTARRFADKLLTSSKMRITRFYRTHILRDPAALAHRRWLRDNGDATLRLDYPLTNQSLVLDAGGYRGDWAAKIHDRYGANIYIFEPVPEFADDIRRRFAGNPSVRVFEFGLADKDGGARIHLDGDATSTVAKSNNHWAIVDIRDAAGFIARERIDRIDLLKINIEGGEYALLRRLLESGLIGICRDIQVQFHEFVPNSHALREELRSGLSKTHRPTYEYFFVWENWRRRD